jgi:frataxin
MTRLRCVPVRTFSVTSARKGIMPDSENPPPKESQPTEQITAATDVPYEEYHQRADEYLEQLQNKLEEMQEGRSDIEVEYSVCLFCVKSMEPDWKILTVRLGRSPYNRDLRKRHLCLEQATAK